MFQRVEGNTTNPCMRNFSCLLAQRLEPQSSNAKLLLPIIPIGIVAYAFTPLWDNLCRNSCISSYTVLKNPKKGETAVHCCDPALSVLVMLVSRNVFLVISALQCTVCLYTLFWQIRSLVDPTSAAFTLWGPSQLLVSLFLTSRCMEKQNGRYAHGKQFAFRNR